MDISTQDKLDIIKQKIASYQRQIYSYKLDLRVAEVLEFDEQKEQVLILTKRAMTAIEILEQELESLKDK